MRFVLYSIMICIILILCSLVNVHEGHEDYDIHLVNMSERRREMSFVGKKIGDFHIFRLIKELKVENAVVRAILLEQINTTGWGHLMVQSYHKYPDELQAYFSGVVESLISRPLITAHWYNTFEGYCSKPSEYCELLHQYLKENFLSLIKKTRNSSGFLKMVRLHLWQSKGIQDGYDGTWKRNSSEINENLLLTLQNQLFKLYLIQVEGDIMSLSKILGGQKYHEKFTGLNPVFNERCSAFIKYVRGSIFTSHVSWYRYTSMLRLTKLYDFPYRINDNQKNSGFVPGRKLSFSSYPAKISSFDDFYITSSGLVTTETTIDNCNDALWKPLKYMASNIIFLFSRVLAANKLATSGESWSQLFATNNSGTYNNQWMIVNHKVMQNHVYGERIPDGVLYVAEQIPSLVVYEDVTEYLRTSFWSSYNIPFFKKIWNLGLFQTRVEKYGDFYDYYKSPRAQIFKRNASYVFNYESLMKLMRYNNFKKDPLARCVCNPPYSGKNGISARCDLNLINGTYPFPTLDYSLNGGIDMKFTSSNMAPFMRFVAINGPTYDQQPVFDWSLIKDKQYKHNMHPERFEFPPVLTPFS